MQFKRQNSTPIRIGPALRQSPGHEDDDDHDSNWHEERDYDDDLSARGRQEELPFALSPDQDEAVLPKEKQVAKKKPEKAKKKPLKLSLNPEASAFVPGGAKASQKVLDASFAKKSQVMVEEKTNEFSISYDEPKATKKVSHSDFEVLKMVGEGGFGRVYQVRHIATKRIYAMKTLRKKFLVNTNNVGYTFVERNVLRKVRHPFVCGLHFAFQTKGKVYLVMDFLNGGQIFYHLKRQTMFGETEVQFYAAEITLALTHLHSLGIIHRDLKPENILLDGKGHVHLTDFGLARDLAGSDVDKTDTYCGTVEYMAPEMVNGEDYGAEVDWWSLGILLYDMLTGSPPWTDKNEKKLCDMIVSSKLVLPSYLSPDVKSLLKGLLQRDVSKRFTGSQVKEHAFFDDLDWDLALEKDLTPPFVPAVPGGDLSTINFDDKYLRKKVAATTPSDHAEELSRSEEAMFTGFSYVRETAPHNFGRRP